MAIRKTATMKTRGANKAKAAPKKKIVARKVSSAAKKVVRKASPRKKKEMEVGACYECSVCGLELSVEKVCGCADACDIICCGEPMEIL